MNFFNQRKLIDEHKSIHLYKLNVEKLSYSKPEKIAVLIEPSYVWLTCHR